MIIKTYQIEPNMIIENILCPDTQECRQTFNRFSKKQEEWPTKGDFLRIVLKLGWLK